MPIGEEPSSAFVHETGRLHRRLEILGDLAAWQQRHLRCNLESPSDKIDGALPRAGAFFDVKMQHVVVTVVVHLGAEVDHIRVAEQRVLELAMVDVDAAHLEEADRAALVLEHGDDGPRQPVWYFSIKNRYEIAGRPAEQ